MTMEEPKMKKRLTQPKNNKYYIRQCTGGLNGAVAGSPTISGADVLCNCVGYANGRFNEIWNDPELKGIVKAFNVQLVCNAENFIESARRQGLKISPSPIEGGIMVWQKGSTLDGYDGAGHVAVVEEVYEDGSILTSESGWAAWAFKTIRRNNTNGRWGQNEYYKFRGCIINPSIKNPKVVPVPKLVVDGIGGELTVFAMQRFFSTPADGVITGQNRNCKQFYPALTSVQFGAGGSVCIKNLQRWVEVTQDGVLGEQTVKAWQKKLGVASDGVFGVNSMKAWQKYLNENDKAIYPKPRKSYKVIDVSEFQGSINWSKVKADGVVGAIIRYADGDYIDKYFDKNMKGAKAAGLHIGAYIFSRAKTKTEAESEATRLFKACQPYGCDMPLYIDLEANDLKGVADANAQAFLNKMKKLGGTGGVYANITWWNNYLTKTADKNPIMWVAQYYRECQYRPLSKVGMWQYSSEGSVKGISGNVDMDECYVAYWKNITPTPTPTPSKKGYTGEYPDIVRTKKLVDMAVKLAWPKGTDEDIYEYPSGRATSAFKVALDKAYPEHNSWGAAPRVGASCDVFVGTVVRYVGLDGKFPRGLEQQFEYEPNWCVRHSYTGIAPADKSQDGDIVLFEHDNGAHAIIRGNGVYYEANYQTYFGHTNESLARIRRKQKATVILRPKNYLSNGDTGIEVKRLQDYLIWGGWLAKGQNDSIFGAKTETAVKKMQKTFGLAQDGLVGSGTLTAMKAYKK